MLDILALAFWTDSTRVGTFMFGNSVSGRNFSFLEAGLGSHHENSHHENKAEKKARYQKINRWHVAQFAYFIERLKASRRIRDRPRQLHDPVRRRDERWQPA